MAIYLKWKEMMSYGYLFEMERKIVDALANKTLISSQ